MIPLRYRPALPVIAATLLATPAFAFLPAPYPPNCTVPTCVRMVPAGNIVTAVIVRDSNNDPIPNSVVSLSYANCPGFVLCTGGPLPDAYFIDAANHRVALVTNAVGSAPFYLRAGGGCVPAALDIMAAGVPLGTARVVSADQNGDLVVDATDVAIVTSKMGTADLSGDLDCDGDVDTLDRDIVANYFGNTCLEATPTHPRSWGSLKLVYR